MKCLSVVRKNRHTAAQPRRRRKSPGLSLLGRSPTLLQNRANRCWSRRDLAAHLPDRTGASCENVVKTIVFLIDLADYPVMNEIDATYFPRHPPARATVQVAALPRGARIEIDAIAFAKRSPG
jgi:enamine deaminase RidA (YjgF/YER057c/UK114 family)